MNGRTTTYLEALDVPRCRKVPLLAIAVLATACNPSRAGPFRMIVAAAGSDTVVEFDIDSGASSVLARFPGGTQPRGIAVNSHDELFVSVRYTF